MRVLLVTALVVAAIAGIVYFYFAQDLGEARARLVGRSQSVETAFGAVEYADTGSGPPILIIHGTGGGFDQGLDMAGQIANGGFRLIVPSRFGYLGSAFPPGATPEMQADAFVPLLDQLGIGETFVFGGSAGALSAMQFAIRHPERCRGLVLLVPAAYAPTRKPNTSGAKGEVAVALVKAMLNSDLLFWLAMKVAPTTMTRMLLATEPQVLSAVSQAEQDRVRSVLRHILPVSVRASGIWMDMQTAGDPQPYPLDKIACPVLTISARDDLFGTADPAEYIAANVANGRAIIYPSGGHLLAGHDSEVWSEIDAFLKSVTRITAEQPTVAAGG